MKTIPSPFVTHRELPVAVVDPLEQVLGDVAGLHHDLLQLGGSAKDLGLASLQDLGEKRRKFKIMFVNLFRNIYVQWPSSS